MILVLILTFKADMITALAKGDLEMFRSGQDSNPDLYDTDTVKYQLSYQPNWRMVIMRVHDNPLKMENICESHLSIPRHLAQCSTS